MHRDTRFPNNQLEQTSVNTTNSPRTTYSLPHSFPPYGHGRRTTRRSLSAGNWGRFQMSYRHSFFSPLHPPLASQLFRMETSKVACIKFASIGQRYALSGFFAFQPGEKSTEKFHRLIHTDLYSTNSRFVSPIIVGSIWPSSRIAHPRRLPSVVLHSTRYPFTAAWPETTSTSSPHFPKVLHFGPDHTTRNHFGLWTRRSRALSCICSNQVAKYLDSYWTSPQR